MTTTTTAPTVTPFLVLVASMVAALRDGYVVVLEPTGPPFEPDDPEPFPEGGPVVPYGSTWEGPSGNYTCASDEDGVRCTNTTGNGFLLNRDAVEEIEP